MRMNTWTLTGQWWLLVAAIVFPHPSFGNDTASDSILSSGRLSEAINTVPRMFLYNPPFDQSDLSRVSHSDYYLPYMVDYLDRWEKNAYDISQLEAINIRRFLLSYQENKLHSLINLQGSYFPENELSKIQTILSDMPKIRSPLYYPLLINSKHIPTLTGRYFRFKEELNVMPGYDKHADFVFQLLKDRKNSDEVLVMLKFNSLNTYAVTTLSEEPDNVDFILNSRNKVYHVSSLHGSHESLYEHESLLQEKSLDAIEDDSSPLILHQHRVHSCP